MLTVLWHMCSWNLYRTDPLFNYSPCRAKKSNGKKGPAPWTRSRTASPVVQDKTDNSRSRDKQLLQKLPAPEKKEADNADHYRGDIGYRTLPGVTVAPAIAPDAAAVNPLSVTDVHGNG